MLDNQVALQWMLSHLQYLPLTPQPPRRPQRRSARMGITQVPEQQFVGSAQVMRVVAVPKRAPRVHPLLSTGGGFCLTRTQETTATIVGQLAV